MLTVYGMMICPDCVKCREELDGAGQDDLLTDAQAAIYHDLAVLEPDAAQ